MPNRHDRNSYTCNPIVGWSRGEGYLQKIVDEQCSMINSMSTSELSKYVDYFTGPNIRRTTGIVAVSFWHCFAFPDDNYGVDPEALVNTVKSIVGCIQARLEGKYYCKDNYCKDNFQMVYTEISLTNLVTVIDIKTPL